METRDLVYRVSVRGQAEATRAIFGIMDTVRKSAAEEINLSKMVEGTKTRTAKEGAGERKKIVTDEQKHKESLERLNLSLEKNAAKQRVKEAADSEKAKTKAVADEEKARMKILLDGGKKVIADARQAARDFERNEREKTRAVERESAKQAQAVKAGMRETEREVRSMFKGVTSILGAGMSGATSMLGNATRFGVRGIVQGLGLQRGYDLGDIISERMLVSRKLRAIAIEARMPGEEFTFDEAAARKRIEGAALKTGISQTDLVQALDVYSEKGLGAQGAKDIDKVAFQAKALNTDAATVAKIRAQLAISSSQTGKEMSSEDIDAALAKISFLGKHGVFRAKDIAAQSEQLFSRYAASGGNFDEGLNKFVAFAEIARSATGGGAMAKTAIGQIQNQIFKHEDKISGMGVATRMKNAEGVDVQRDFIDVMMDVVQHTGAKGKAFTDIFDVKSMGAINPFISAFNNAGGGKKGRAAMEKLLSGAELPEGFRTQEEFNKSLVAEMNKDASHAVDDESTKIAKSLEEVRQKIGSALAPAITQLTDVLVKAVPSITSVIDFASKHPLLAAAGLGGAGFVGGAGSKALTLGGQAISSALMSMGGGASEIGKALGTATAIAGATPVYVAGAAPGVFGAGGAGGVAAGVGKGAAIVTAAVVGYEVGKAIAPPVFKETGINDEIDKLSGLKSNANEGPQKPLMQRKAKDVFAKGLARTFAFLGSAYEGIFDTEGMHNDMALNASTGQLGAMANGFANGFGKANVTGQAKAAMIDNVDTTGTQKNMKELDDVIAQLAQTCRRLGADISSLKIPQAR